MRRSSPDSSRPWLACGGLAWLLVVLSPHTLHATEGGTGHYLPGGVATLVDLAPTKPGFVVETMFLHYEGDAAASLPVAGEVTAGLDVESDALLLGGLYTFEPKILGARYSLGAFLPYVWMTATAEVETPFGTFGRRDRASGIGDLTLLPAMLAWERGYWQANAVLTVYAPTGDYDTGRLANPGLNYWTFDPTLGVSYNHDERGFNAALYAGIAFSTENDDTDYHSGATLHLEASAQQLLPLGSGFLSLGAEAFLLEQIEGDDGSGARFGDFEGRSWGVGPVLGYVLPWSGRTLVAEVRWLPEIGVRRRLEGDHVWLKLVLQF